MKPKLYGCMGVLAGLMLAGLAGCSGENVELAGADKQAVSTRTEELVSCTIENLESGTLGDRLSEEMGDDAGNVQELIITGSFSSVDAEYLRNNLRYKLVKIDLSGVDKIQQREWDGYDENWNSVYRWDDHDYLPSSCFESMYYLEEIILPPSITSIQDYTFRNCSSLKVITLPDAVTTIGDYALVGCSSLTEITLPDKVTSIGSYAFASCSALQNVNMPSRLITIREGVFEYCSALETIDLPEGLTELSDYVFSDCSSLTGIEIPASVAKLGNSVFSRCTSLTEITIPSTVTSVGTSLLYGATSLISAKIMADIDKLPDSCFDRCTLLTDIELSSSVKSLGNYAFRNCESLTQTSLITDYQIDGDYVFENTGYSDLDLTHFTVIPCGAFQNCKNLQHVTFSPDLTEIAREAFYNNPSLTDIEFPENLETIGSSAFSLLGCKNITLPSSLKEIGVGAFRYSSVESVELPEGLITIGSQAFYDTQLRSVTIPASLTSIGSNVFGSCENLSSVIWKSALDVPDLGLGNNCLLYINTFNGTAPSFYYQLRNVIIDGVAESIVLKSQSNYAFGCPEAFTAKKISYTMDFPNRYVYTSQGKSSNWRTISLPFTPTKISHAEKGILAPFNSEVDDAKPFWLRSLTADGFEDVTEIEPNRAYIIAMPYNPNLYLDDYNISGSVTFEAENVEVPVTGELESSEGQDFVMYPTYTYMASSEDFYGMYHNYSSDESCFKTKQDVHPFEAYVTSATARSVISMTGKRSSTRAAADDPRLKQKGKPRIDDM